MRWLGFACGVLLLAAAGCHSGGSGESAHAAQPPKPAGVGVTQPQRAAKQTPGKSPRPASPNVKTNAPAPRYPLITPVIRCWGTVAQVDVQSRFVVIDFSFNPLPKAEQRLGVYRQGQKVGEVRVSGAARGGFMAADILAGEAQLRDEVHEE